MPCVCLSNTYARWATLKAEKRSEIKPTIKFPRRQSTLSALLHKLAPQRPFQKPAAQPPRILRPLQPAVDDGFIYTPSLQIQHSRIRLSPEKHDQSAATPLSDLIVALSARSQPAQPAFYIPEPLTLSAHPTRADLINAESRLGSTLFGPIPVGHRREFFHDRNNVWIWHEDWLDAAAQPQQLTVRYEVRTSGIFKKVAAGRYLKLEGDELDNFRKATHAYLDIIKTRLYNPNILTF